MELPKGVFAATLTPLNADLSVDHDLLYAHCTQLVEDGGDGIALLGTTGEANSFSLAERCAILNGLVSRGFPPHRMIVSTGCCSSSETITLSRHATRLGVGGILLMPPFYYRQVTDEGLYRYFVSIIDGVASDALRIYLYHFPRMSGIHMSTDLVVRLVGDYPGIVVGMKDSGGDIGHMREVLTALRNFKLYAGNEKLMLDVLELRGGGCISATTNYSMRVTAQVYKAWQAGGVPLMLAKQMNDMRSAFEGYVMSSALKSVLAHQTGNVQWEHIRPPLTLVDQQSLESILKDLAAAG